MMLPGSIELRKGGGMDRGGKKLSLVTCILRVEDRCDEKTAMCWLLGVRTELQRSSCRITWCSVKGARKRNGKRVALGRAGLGWG